MRGQSPVRVRAPAARRLSAPILSGSEAITSSLGLSRAAALSSGHGPSLWLPQTLPAVEGISAAFRLSVGPRNQTRRLPADGAPGACAFAAYRFPSIAAITSLRWNCSVLQCTRAPLFRSYRPSRICARFLWRDVFGRPIPDDSRRSFVTLWCRSMLFGEFSSPVPTIATHASRDSHRPGNRWRCNRSATSNESGIFSPFGTKPTDTDMQQHSFAPLTIPCCSRTLDRQVGGAMKRQSGGRVRRNADSRSSTRAAATTQNGCNDAPG